ncbi:hypothetical protein [Gordonia sp. (in: high G+C Gram-positive bacteria)]|jgi:hypothetical protein|uniref:hypothetical protein n=1 Tax=Gordonia sp. (in: high G+C Gram-positive bacteria) TaxID=84139 RepID=UPI0025B9E6C0|nr:hypothetical protein [Gordonia sp. (in: high G+C Gram-positive bacteria)]HMS74272.1 hypothetical protein [Gordonia sp. (in: high G+C Gram-positive bacteria)]
MKALKKAAAAGLAVAGLAAGTIAGTAPAQAAWPGDLQIRGSVKCVFGQWGQPWNQLWYMKRSMTVKNVGGTTIRNVTLSEFNGRTVHINEVKPGKTVMIYNKAAKRWQYPIETRWAGCVPSSISGYTISPVIENIDNNVGAWRNEVTMARNAPSTPWGVRAGNIEQQIEKGGAAVQSPLRPSTGSSSLGSSDFGSAGFGS